MKIINLSLALAVLTLAASCQKQPAANNPSGSIAARVCASGATSDQTKASVVEDNDNLASGETFRWDESDQLSLAIAPSGANTISSWNTFAMVNSTLSDNKQSADFSGNINSGNTGDVLYGLYPGTYIWENSACVNLEIPSGFTQTNDATTGASSTDHLKESLFMYGKATLNADVTESASTVYLPHLEFHHLCALLRFRVRNATNIAWKVTAITLIVNNSEGEWLDTYFRKNGTLDLTTSGAPAFTPDEKYNDLALLINNCPTLPKSTSFETGNHLNAYMPILPTGSYNSDYSGDDYLSITVSLEDADGRINSQTLEYQAPIKSFVLLRDGFQAGLRYYFNLTIDNELRFGGVTVTDWNDNVLSGGEAIEQE